MQETQEMCVGALGQKDALENKMQPTLVSLPAKFHRPRNLEGYTPGGHKRAGHN